MRYFEVSKLNHDTMVEFAKLCINIVQNRYVFRDGKLIDSDEPFNVCSFAAFDLSIQSNTVYIGYLGDSIKIIHGHYKLENLCESLYPCNIEFLIVDMNERTNIMEGLFLLMTHGVFLDMKNVVEFPQDVKSLECIPYRWNNISQFWFNVVGSVFNEKTSTCLMDKDPVRIMGYKRGSDVIKAESSCNTCKTIIHDRGIVFKSKNYCVHCFGSNVINCKEDAELCKAETSIFDVMRNLSNERKAVVLSALSGLIKIIGCGITLMFPKINYTNTPIVFVSTKNMSQLISGEVIISKKYTIYRIM